MNQTIIQERSGLNQFYAKVLCFCGTWDWSIGSRVSFDVDSLSGSIGLLFNAWPSLVDDCNFCRTCSGLCCKQHGCKNSPAALPVFLVYSVLNGFTLSFVVAFYTPGTVLSAFVSSALLFFVMAAIGIFTKKDLSGMGRALMAALVGLIIAMVVNLFFSQQFSLTT